MGTATWSTADLNVWACNTVQSAMTTSIGRIGDECSARLTLAIILFGVLGLSHILQPKAWAEFFILLRGKGEAGAFVDGFLNLPLAGIIIGFHNVWSGIPVVLTLVGWCLLIKSLIRFCAPKLALRMMARVSVERCWEFQVAGSFLMVLAVLLGYGVYAG